MRLYIYIILRNALTQQTNGTKILLHIAQEILSSCRSHNYSCFRQSRTDSVASAFVCPIFRTVALLPRLLLYFIILTLAIVNIACALQ